MSGVPAPKPYCSFLLDLPQCSLSCPWGARVDIVLPIMLHQYCKKQRNHFPGYILSSSAVLLIAAPYAVRCCCHNNAVLSHDGPFVHQDLHSFSASSFLGSQPLASIIDCSDPSSELRFCLLVFFCQLSSLVTPLWMAALLPRVACKVVHAIWCYPWTCWACIPCHCPGCS